ncbi:MAG: hypothetical protein I8H81_07135 [Pseudomonadales bacterium]|nr:hypothetical protein [Pseudomonas sp. p50(2008)]MBH1967942.1 hypothetical protein [Pseudomonadales bacterium]MBH2033404.1 hypothetical protein [Pseudomonadales bacterium]MBH2077975.1 hypothetical protein [Pseudomonadales bacterium]
MNAQKRMEEALSQQTILDLARKVGRKAPAEFGEQVDHWMNERREKKSNVNPQAIPVNDITD